MESINYVSPSFWGISILITGALFTFFWMLDAIQHKKVVDEEISNSELQTHRVILISSLLMEISLIAFYWYQIEVLPFFMALFFTRTTHEVLDESHYHMDRCTPYETLLHLGMWISILSNTILMFMWGFFTQYQGLFDLHPLYFVFAFVILIFILIIGAKEWERKKIGN